MQIALSMIVSSLISVPGSSANHFTELNNWLINAFNGEWLRTANAVPIQIDPAKEKREIQVL